MVTSAPASFTELFPELFSIISAHLPLSTRVPTLLSLALTCRRFHDVVIPHLLYYNVCLVGNKQTSPALGRFITAAKAVGEDGAREEGNPSPSHCVHYLCIDSGDSSLDRESSSCLEQLQKLMEVDGLRNLVSLTLHLKGLHVWGEPPSLSTPFWNDLKTGCPDLKEIHMTGVSQDHGTEWIQSDLFSIEGLTSIRLEGDLTGYTENTSTLIQFDLSNLPSSLHTLELRLADPRRLAGVDAPGFLSSVFPNLHTLILDHFEVPLPSSTSQFWKAHPDLERLELWRGVKGNWFDGFEDGMLPNLKNFKSDFASARALLPHIAQHLVTLCVVDTYNAQAPYLLRAIPPNGTLPALRSLGIHRRQSGNSPKPFEGHRWREDENGGSKEVPVQKAARRFDGNYLMSVAKAAPNLEELELMGDSDDTIGSITASLSRLPKLQRLTLSGPINGYNIPFFKSSYNWEDYARWDIGGVPEKQYGKYRPTSFEQAANDLADGCRTLEVVTIGNMIGDLLIQNGISGRVVREIEGGPVKEVRRIRAWGNIIGREDEW